MQLEIVTPDEKVFEGEVRHVQLPGKEGLFGILNNHAPIVSTLTKGRIKVEAIRDRWRCRGDEQQQGHCTCRKVI
jgi:F-type H+-transporting ATPase subunit epsilon